MGKYVVRRILLMIPTIWILTLIVFLLLRVLPGDIALAILSDPAGGVTASRETLEILRHKLGIDRPLHIQYVEWLWNTARGDLGKSLFNGRPVFDDLVIRAPITAQLALMGLFMGLVVGIPLGALSAVYQNSPLDYVLRLFSITFLAVPNFWIALLVILGLAVWFDYYPPSGMNLIWEDPLENLKQLMWPSVILGSSGMATISRMTRSTMLEVMREDYIRTARAKGIQERVVIIRHAMKNALIPVITLAGLTFAGLMGGTVILESVFGIPGIGLYFIDAIRVLDYTIVQGAVVVFGLTFMGANLVVDLVYGWFDPRISYD